jgi:hypothetical protein
VWVSVWPSRTERLGDHASVSSCSASPSHYSLRSRASIHECPSLSIVIRPSIMLGSPLRFVNPRSFCPSVFPVILPFCPSLLLSFCPSVLLSFCPSALLPFCPSVLLSFFPSVLLSSRLPPPTFPLPSISRSTFHAHEATHHDLARRPKLARKRIIIIRRPHTQSDGRVGRRTFEYDAEHGKPRTRLWVQIANAKGHISNAS